MLQLTRKRDEGLTITVPASEDTTVIHIVSRPNPTNPSQTQLGIDAPRNVSILRDELIERDRKAALKQGAQ